MSDSKQTPNASYASMAEMFGTPLYSDEEVRELRAADEETDLEQAVIDAAVAYTLSVRASRSVNGVADEFAHQYFESEQGELNAALLVATDSLIAARAHTTEK